MTVDPLIAPGVHLRIDDLSERVTTSGGPGGQHANRSRTRVVVTWSFDEVALPDTVRERLRSRFGDRITSSASRYRSQGQNREAAIEQLVRRVRAELTEAPPRRPTRPTRASAQRRVEEKRARSRLKRERRGGPAD